MICITSRGHGSTITGTAWASAPAGRALALLELLLISYAHRPVPAGSMQVPIRWCLTKRLDS